LKRLPSFSLGTEKTDFTLSHKYSNPYLNKTNTMPRRQQRSLLPLISIAGGLVAIGAIIGGVYRSKTQQTSNSNNNNIGISGGGIIHVDEKSIQSITTKSTEEISSSSADEENNNSRISSSSTTSSSFRYHSTNTTTKGDSHAGLACATKEMEMIVVELASKDAIVASLDAKLASKDASMHDELLSTNAMVDSMTQEMEKLGVELVSKNAIIASLDAKLESMNDELLLKKIMIDRFKAIITRETELLLERGKGIPKFVTIQ
jgi:hypothetical protein